MDVAEKALENAWFLSGMRFFRGALYPNVRKLEMDLDEKSIQIRGLEMAVIKETSPVPTQTTPNTKRWNVQLV